MSLPRRFSGVEGSVISASVGVITSAGTVAEAVASVGTGESVLPQAVKLRSKNALKSSEVNPVDVKQYSNYGEIESMFDEAPKLEFSITL